MLLSVSDTEVKMPMKQTEKGLPNLGALLLAFFITGIYFVFIYQMLPFIYDINDDVAMRNVAAGVITGSPDAHLLHIKYLLGLVIAGFYRLLPGFDWYGLVLIGIMLFSLAMVLYRGLAAKKGIFWKFCYTALTLLLFTCIGLKHVTAFQWTVTAAMAGSAGIYLFYTADRDSGFWTRMEEGTAVFLLLLSLAVRDDVFLMVLPVAALCFWWKYGSVGKSSLADIEYQKKLRLYFTTENGKSWNVQWKGWNAALSHINVILGLLAGILVLLGTEGLAYRSMEWREFCAYNVNREAIMDYYGLKNYEEDPAFFDSLGITPEEAENLQRYSLYLVEDLYSEKMAALAEHSREVYIREHPFGQRISTAVEKIDSHLGEEDYHPVNLLCLGLLAGVLGLCFGKNRRQLGLVLSVTGVWAAYWFYLGYRDRIVERVGFALYLLMLLTMLAVWYRVVFLEHAGEDTGSKGGKLKGRLLTVGSFLLLALFNGPAWKAVKENNTARRDYNLEFLDVNRYMAEHMENVYFMTTFSIETYTDNFTVSRDFAFSNLLSVGGWHTFSPLENVKNEKLGITDPKKDLAEKEQVYLISLEQVNLRYMNRYYESVYGDGYQGMELVDKLDYGERIFEVYRLCVKPLGKA